MHIQKFAQRLSALASTPQTIERIIVQMSQAIASHRIHAKDVQSLVKQLRTMLATKPTLRAPKSSVVTQPDQYDFEQSNVLGIEVIEGDRIYKRTFTSDVDKLLS